MYNKAFLWILSILCFPVNLYAKTQNSDIETFYKKLTIRPFISVPSVKFKISDCDSNGYTFNGITYKPNNYIDMGAAVYYKQFGISFSSSLFGKTKPTKDEDKYGSSKTFNLQLYYYFRKIGCDLFWQKYSGFYLAKQEKYGYYVGDANTIRSDIKISNISANIYYIFADNFSFASSMYNTERQNKSKGSFLLMLTIGRLQIESNASLIPETEESEFDEDAGYSGGIYHSLGILPGFAYNFVYRNFYCTPSIFLGAGIMHKDYDTDEGNKKKYESFNKFNARIAIGYNGDNYFFGAFALNDTTSTRSWLFGSGLKVSFQIIKIEFYGGTRF